MATIPEVVQPTILPTRPKGDEPEETGSSPNLEPPPMEGEGRRTRRNIIGPLREGKLTNLGYSPAKKATTRRRALASAVKK